VPKSETIDTSKQVTETTSKIVTEVVKSGRELGKDNAEMRELLTEQVSLVKRLIDATLEKKNNHLEPYEWRKNKPTLITYLREWYNSLDDTPALFTAAQNNKIKLPREVRRYFKTKSHPIKFEPKSWTIDNMFENLPPQSVMFVSVFDLSQSWKRFETPGRAYHDFLEEFEYKDSNGETVAFNFHDTTEIDGWGRNDLRREPSLWSRYLDGNPQAHVSYESLDSGVKEQLSDKPSYRQSIIASHQKALLELLADSVSFMRPELLLLLSMLIILRKWISE
jgi:hypothetical protein